LRIGGKPGSRELDFQAMETNRIDKALTRLSSALNLLETTAARRLESEMSLADLEEELAVMQDDRSRLALELDSELAKAHALEKARDDVLRRLERASDGIKSVLGEAAGEQ
jgi:chromosome segregation ATPase